jgi:hypothetical protein
VFDFHTARDFSAFRTNLFENIVKNNETTVAFARDIRISQNRRAIMSWGQHVLPVMKEIEKNKTNNFLFLISLLALDNNLNRSYNHIPNKPNVH